MQKVACYIDGFNFYHAVDALDKDHLKWLDMKKLASFLIKEGEVLESTVYFTAYMHWNQSKQARHKEYVAALESVGVQCVISKFNKVKKYCDAGQRDCKSYVEKQTDVALATHMLATVVTQNISRLILITADSDQVPTIAAIRAIAPATVVTVIAPPLRGSQSRELRSIAHSHKELSVGLLYQALFPRNVRNSAGDVVAISPAKYQRHGI